MDNRHIRVSVWRSDKTGGGFHDYRVPMRESQTVLDLVTWIQQNADPTLSYRFACRVGMCGSCAMMVNGRPRWTCRTHVRRVVKGEALSIAPLRNLPVVKDLVTDMDGFFDKWVAAEGVFRPTASRADAVATVKPESPARMAADAAVECINCAVCYAACDAVSANPDYLGPAALNRAWSLVNDVRDAARGERLSAVSRETGCHNCHSQQGCAEHCPVALNPTASIAGLKRETVKYVFRRGG